MQLTILEQTKKEGETKMKTLQYMVIDIGDVSEPTETRIEKLLAQIPKGKTIVITDKDLNLPQNKIIVRVMDEEDIPKPT